MVDEVVSSGAYVIVLTPFVFGNFLSDARARRYGRNILAAFAGRTDVCVIDAWSLLNQYPRSEMLLNDGFHLSRQAHEVVAQSLKVKLVERIQTLAASGNVG